MEQLHNYEADFLLVRACCAIHTSSSWEAATAAKT